MTAYLLKEFLIINCQYRFPCIKPIYSLNLPSHLLTDLIFLTLVSGDSGSLICRGESPAPGDSRGLHAPQPGNGREGLESPSANPPPLLLVASERGSRTSCGVVMSVIGPKNVPWLSQQQTGHCAWGCIKRCQTHEAWD